MGTGRNNQVGCHNPRERDSTLKRKDITMGGVYYWCTSKKWATGDPRYVGRPVTPIHLGVVYQDWDGNLYDTTQGRFALGPGLLVRPTDVPDSQPMVVQLMDLRGPYDETLQLVQQRQTEWLADPEAIIETVVARLQRVGVGGVRVDGANITIPYLGVKHLLDRGEAPNE